ATARALCERTAMAVAWLNRNFFTDSISAISTKPRQGQSIAIASQPLVKCFRRRSQGYLSGIRSSFDRATDPARDRLRRGKDLRMAEGEEPQSTKRSRATTRQDNNARISHGGCRNSVADGCAPASHGG